MLIARGCWAFSNYQHRKLGGGSENLPGIFPPAFPPCYQPRSSAVSTELTIFVEKIGLWQPRLSPGEPYPTRPKHRPALFPTNPACTSQCPTNPTGSPRAAPGTVIPMTSARWIKNLALPSRAANWVSLQQLLPPVSAGFGFSLFPLEMGIRGSNRDFSESS